MPLELVTIPCLSDNYAYLAHDSESGRTAVVDVPEAAPILAALQDRNWQLSDIWITHHHGDHVGGELDAAKALVQGKIDAAWMIDGNHLAFSSDGTLPSGQTKVLARTAPFDHCNFTVSPDAPADLIARFTELILGMRWDDPAVRPLLELEGLRQWKTGRTSGYAALERAVDDEGFYNAAGSITAQNYQY